MALRRFRWNWVRFVVVDAAEHFELSAVRVALEEKAVARIHKKAAGVAVAGEAVRECAVFV